MFLWLKSGRESDVVITCLNLLNLLFFENNLFLLKVTEHFYELNINNTRICSYKNEGKNNIRNKFHLLLKIVMLCA